MVAGILVLYGLALISAGSLLMARDVLANADIIVVLGGDGPPRAARAAALWHQRRAPLVLVTGRGDCNFIRQLLIEAGVKPEVITTECQSASTWENATFSQPILIGMQVRSAILVTSWFHSGRAVKRFRSLMPDIRWISVPAEREKSYWRLVFDIDGVQIVKEYIKTIAYDVRGQISAAAAPKALLLANTDAGR
ncbi:YdcF family protein [Neorhizobium sp. Rsf11]|uniref:YdcF family protein n=1 Tax=Neorhizobium phenanthreniclasticum TaxID=3157917 RepID=A0ABV0M973_9HYPH